MHIGYPEDCDNGDDNDVTDIAVDTLQDVGVEVWLVGGDGLSGGLLETLLIEVVAGRASCVCVFCE